MDASPARPLDRWFAHYSDDHRHAVNQRIHAWCLPLIVWSVIALLWCIPAPGTWFHDGVWAGAAMLVATLFYYRASRPLGLGMLVAFVLAGLLARGLFDAFGRGPLLAIAIAVFVVAWIGQRVGHRIEGRRPGFMTDLTHLSVGPAWLLAKLYRRFGRAC